MLPLYAQIPRDAFYNATSAHTGLLFDKFPDGWNPEENYQPKHKDRNGKVIDDKKTYFDLICNKYTQIAETHLHNNLDSALSRQRDLVNHLQGESLTVNTDWRFISGLGTAHPYETGFIWHRTLSVPYLPGSSVKGLIRAWAEQWCELFVQQQVSHLFGTEKTENKDARCGALIIFDALPSKPPKLEIDILNPHYSEYYQNPENPPADYLSPIPVFFLSVAAEQEFEFLLAPRQDAASEQAQQDLETGLELLMAALETLGAGGKTAVGYGTFIKSKTAQKKCGAEFRAEQAAKEVSDHIESERLMNLSPLEKELENFLKVVPEQEWDTRLLQELEKGSWSGEKAKYVAEKIKQLMEKADKWHPAFTGSNRQKLKYKDRSLKVLKFLND